MVKRNIIEIDEEKCNGCGLCVPNCHEGAIQIIDGKAKLVKEQYCDGLGNCLGKCPLDAIKIVEKDVADFDFKETNKHLKEIGKEELKENPLEAQEDNKMQSKKDDLPCGCPGTALKSFNPSTSPETNAEQASELSQWPVQLSLLPPKAPFFENSHLLVAADCVAFANPNFHSSLLHGKKLCIGCPKLDNIEEYTEKLTAIFKQNKIKSVTIAVMEVPCCQGLHSAVEEAVKASGKNIPIIKETISIKGDIIY